VGLKSCSSHRFDTRAAGLDFLLPESGHYGFFVFSIEKRGAAGDWREDCGERAGNARKKCGTSGRMDSKPKYFHTVVVVGGKLPIGCVQPRVLSASTDESVRAVARGWSTSASA